MEGQVIVRADVRRPDLRFAFPDGFAGRLTGAVVERLGRRAKYLVAHLSTGEVLVMHLGMSGRFTIDRPGAGGHSDGPGEFVHARATDPKHDHVVLYMSGGAVVSFNDPRRFGYMDLAPGDALEMCKHFAGLGPEPLSNGFHAQVLFEALAKKATPIKSALLDQRVVAGLGNIYVCEALFRAGISPKTPARALSGEDADALCVAIRDVLGEAIEAGGSSLRDHAQTDGSMGYFQHNFAVYGREGEACRRAGCAGEIVRYVQSGRSSFLCPVCQVERPCSRAAMGSGARSQQGSGGSARRRRTKSI